MESPDQERQQRPSTDSSFAEYGGLASFVELLWGSDIASERPAVREARQAYRRVMEAEINPDPEESGGGEESMTKQGLLEAIRRAENGRARRSGFDDAADFLSEQEEAGNE